MVLNESFIVRAKIMAKGIELFDCVIIGAGASGMMAAIQAARCGARVLIIEHGKKPGRKLLATGNGKCNFTNEYMNISCYHGDDSLFSILDCFSKDETISFFHEIGVFPRKKKGYYYPNSEQAASVVGALERELKRLNVKLLTETVVSSIEELPNKVTGNRNSCHTDGFKLATNIGTYRTRTIIFATGLLASPKLGSDGSAFDLIKGFGHHFTKIVPALCGFYANGLEWKKVSGVRCDACVQIFVDGVCAAVDTGELQLTDYGISGIPIFQVSRCASLGIDQKQKVEVSIRFLPELSRKELAEEFRFRLVQSGNQMEAYDLLDGLMNQKLIPVLLHKAGLSERTKVTGIQQLQPLLELLLDCRIELTKSRDYEFAQVCAGGIATEDIYIDTLMSRLVPGLFFCGELLDVDGICGGYNLQWAWSSGYAAGKHAAAYARTNV
jgi:hypothetical protein